MKNFLSIILVLSLFASLSSCNGTANAEQKRKVQNTNQLYEKYKQMVTEGEGCEPCIDCAALALAMTYDTQSEITASKQKLLVYYKEKGEIPCPELLPELKEEIALTADSE